MAATGMNAAVDLDTLVLLVGKLRDAEASRNALNRLVDMCCEAIGGSAALLLPTRIGWLLSELKVATATIEKQRKDLDAIAATPAAAGSSISKHAGAFKVTSGTELTGDRKLLQAVALAIAEADHTWSGTLDIAYSELPRLVADIAAERNRLQEQLAAFRAASTLNKEPRS